MFSRCASIENLDINFFNTSSVINMGHMFEGCKSLKSINLSNFNTNNVENMDYMFANNGELVYINLENMNSYNLKSIVNIFLGTVKNMVFCIDKQNASKFNEKIEEKSCSVVSCSSDWKNKRNKIDAETYECIEGDCSEYFKFFLNYYCIEYCPTGYIPHNYKCIDNETSIDDDNSKAYNISDNNTINNNDIDNEIKCDRVQYWFMRKNNKEFEEFNNDVKQKFIEATKKCLIKRGLYELAMRAVKDKEIFTINTHSEVLQIYSLTNKIRFENLTYVDFDQCVMVLNEKYGFRKLDEVIVFKIEYKSNGFMIPIIEYLLFGRKGRILFRLDHCKNLKINYYIPKEIYNYKEYKYNPESQYYNDKCYSHSEKNKDVILFDRRFEFNINNMSLCESICKFKGYINNQIICECQVKMKFNSYFNNNSYLYKYNLIHRFETNLSKFSFNIWVTKCYHLIFKKENLLSNACAFIMFFILLINIIGAIIFFCWEYDKLVRKLQITMILTKENINENSLKQEKKNKIVKEKKDEKLILQERIAKELEKANNIYQDKKININKRKNKQTKDLNSNSTSKIQLNSTSILENKNVFEKNNFMKFKNKELLNKKEEIREFLIKTDNEMNSLSYRDALILDKRSFCQYYFSLIRIHQIIIFTIHTKKDYNSRVIKICYLFFIYALVLIINILFIDDSTLYFIRIIDNNNENIKINFVKIIMRLLFHIY